MRNAAGEFDDIDTARYLALSIREDLSVFGCDDCSQFIAMPVHQLKKPQHDAGSADWRRVAPLRKCSLGACHSGVSICDLAQQKFAWPFTSSRIENRLGTHS